MPPPLSLPKPGMTALGRKLNLPRERASLERACQFAKKILYDPALTGDLKRKPEYLTAANRRDEEEGNMALGDPRLLHPSDSRTASRKPLLSTFFVWNSNSKGRPPPQSLLIRGIPEKVISKSLFANILGTVLDQQIVDEIEDINLAPGAAHLSLKTASSSSLLVNRLSKVKIDGETWEAKYDPDGAAFKSWINTTKKPQSTTASAASAKIRLAPLLKCSRKVTCILISYSQISQIVYSRKVEEIFHKCRIYNVERGQDSWHIHLMNEDEVEFVRRWRKDFSWLGKPLKFEFDRVEDPGPILPFVEESSPLPLPLPPPLKKSESFESGHRSQGHNEHHGHRRSIFSSTSSLSKSDSRSDLDSYYRPASSLQFSNESVPLLQTMDEHEALSTLPIFNRRLIERQRQQQREEEEAAAFAADKARLELEQRMAEALAQREQKAARSKRKTCSKAEPLMPKALHDPDTSMPILATNAAGCARLEGFDVGGPKKPKTAIYIEEFTHPIPTIHEVICAANNAATAGNQPNVSSSRSNRAQNRRLQVSFENYSGELFSKSSAFSSRKKKLILGRSSIHSWGLFCGEDIEAGDMVIEYVGEMIRHTVANIRERKYELALLAKGSSEMASSYFFRLDDKLVIDATHKGNLSRFVNHSCDPSCVARILAVDGTRRIVMYARRDIRVGEEITYDYKFPLEEDPSKKIKCLCSARNCRGTLN